MYYIGDIVTYISTNTDYIIYNENYLLFYHPNLKSLLLERYSIHRYKKFFNK